MLEPSDEQYYTQVLIAATSAVIFVIILGFTILFLSACTISFQNISTHGTATDLVDEDMKTDPDIKTSLTIPAIGK